MIESDHIEEQAAAHALGALPPEEATQVEQHVKVCPPCQRALVESQEVAAQLALTVAPVRPSAQCKARLMTQIEREGTAQPRRRRWLADMRSPAAGTSETSSRPWAFMPPWMMRTAASAALVALLVWNIQLQREVDRSRMIQDMVVKDHTPSALKPEEGVASQAVARMFKGANGSDAVLVIENLPPPPPGKVYQVWIANEQMQQPMDTFAETDSMAQVIMHAPEPFQKFKWVMITVEDAGGSTKPSETTVLFGDL